MERNSLTETGYRATIEAQAGIIGGLRRSGETELYETILRGNARDWRYLEKGKRDKATLQNMVEYKIADINLLLANIDKNIPYSRNRERNLKIAQNIMQDLLDDFVNRTSPSSIPRQEIISVDFIITHDRIGDNAKGLFLLNELEAGEKTLGDVKKEHETDYKLIRKQSTFKKLEREYAKEKNYWLLQGALVPWHYSEDKYPLRHIALEQDDPRMLYGAHIILAVDEVREELIKKVGYDMSRRNPKNRKYFPRICNRLLVKALHESQPEAEEAPYTLNIV